MLYALETRSRARVRIIGIYRLSALSLSAVSDSTCLKAELLEAEGQRDNYYYNLHLANPDYPAHYFAFIRA